MPFEKERQFYRTQIPPGDVAVFRVGSLQMPILEISERGFRYAPAPGHDPEVGSAISGIAAFKTIGEHEVTGTLSRTQGKSLVAVLDAPGIPHATLMALQLFLRKRYPGRA
ncbi:MAG TPA: hypothetical protein VF128_14345 [Gemmatimonadaceae bacterium]